MKIEKWLNVNTKSLKGKKVAVSGSTGGLGGNICKFVAQLGGDLVLVDRNEKRSKVHAEELREKYGVNAKTIIVDMVDMMFVKKACGQLKKEDVDILILNAGAYSLPRQKSSEGYDQVFQINFVSPYYIVKEMLSSLREKEGKVVVVGSIAHKYSKTNEEDVDFSKVKAPRKVYGNAKRFLMFSLFELFKNEEKVSLAIAHPGITPTNITSHYPRWIRGVIKYPMKWIFTSPKKASLNIIKGVFDACPYCTWIGPRIVNVWGRPKLKNLKSSTPEERKKIFGIAENIYEKVKAENAKVHELGLKAKYYELIKSGIKIYEGRLNDDKRKLIKIGDIIEVKKEPERNENFKVRVVDKLFFDTFYEMATTLPSKDIGFDGKTPSDIADAYGEFYSKENENKFGVVAIKIEKIN